MIIEVVYLQGAYYLIHQLNLSQIHDYHYKALKKNHPQGDKTEPNPILYE